MGDYVGESTSKKSYKFGECGSYECLLFLFVAVALELALPQDVSQVEW